MLSLETCQKLKEAGWEQGQSTLEWCEGSSEPIDRSKFFYVHTVICACPSLEELLEAIRVLCNWYVLRSYGDGYVASSDHEQGVYSECQHTDPSEAAAALWLKLKDAKGA